MQIAIITFAAVTIVTAVWGGLIINRAVHALEHDRTFMAQFATLTQVALGAFMVLAASFEVAMVLRCTLT